MNKDNISQYEYPKQKLLEMSQKVADWREKYQDKYPWPNMKDSIAFALCETAEAIDALLRLNGEYKRNNQKDNDVLYELGDAMFMIMSVMDYIPNNVYKTSLIDYSGDIEQISLATSTLSMALIAESDEHKFGLLDLAVSAILGFDGWDWKYMEATMKKLEDKHIKND